MEMLKGFQEIFQQIHIENVKMHSYFFVIQGNGWRFFEVFAS